MKKKFGMSLGQAPAAVLIIVLIAVTAVVGVRINAQLQTGYSAGNAVYDAAANSTLGIQQITSQLSLIGLIVAMAIVIGILFGAFGGMFRGGGL